MKGGREDDEVVGWRGGGAEAGDGAVMLKPKLELDSGSE